MTTETNAAPAADDGKGIPADMVVDDAGAPEQAAAPSEEEVRAYRLGWRPKDEFRGPETKWLPHDKFLQKVEAETPILRERLRSQDNIIQSLQRDLSDTKKLSQEQGEALKELLDRSRGAEVRGFHYALDQTEARMDEAAANGNQEAYHAAKRERAELLKLQPRAPEPKKADPAAPAPDPATAAWVQENPWFTADEELNDYAISAERRLMRKNPNMSTRDRLEKVKEEVEKRYPDKFENTARAAAPPVSRPGPQGARPAAQKKEKTLADVDADAKAAFGKLQKLIPGYKWSDYIKDYKG